MDIHLNNEEVRVLGCLLEKEMATPEYYPLTLNALINACNQKTNREPVVAYDEKTVLAAVNLLRDKKLVRQSSVSRVLKYEQIFSEERKLITREAAILCILLLRGPQTIGEIRGRSERLYPFPDLEEVKNAITSLEDMQLIKKLARQPGHKESRYAQLLGGEPRESAEEPVVSDDTGIFRATDIDRIGELQEQIDGLKEQIELLKEEFARFRSQFE